MHARRMRALFAVLLVACGSRTPPLHKAGTETDDGHGLLARASSRFLTEDPADDAPPPRRTIEPEVDEDEDTPEPSAYGGATYGSYVVPQWPALAVDRRPKYRPTGGLTGSVEGVVTWRGALPRKLTTSCGAIEPLPIGPDRGLSGALVYIERVAIGRPLPNDGKPASVGGLVVKRGCALAPALQIATPLPAALHIRGDAKTAKLRIAPPAGAPQTFDLEAAGHRALQLQPGVTRIDASDGTLASAWIFAIDAPYYALTDDRGRFRLEELGPGTYEVVIVQAPVATLVKGALTYGPPIVARRSVRIDVARTTRLDVALGR